MINLIENWKLLPSPDAARPEFAWTRLKQYQNEDFVSELLVKEHSPKRSQISSVKKHARDIRYCLIQAKEYFDAAAAVDYATRGVLLYYGAISLALAQILLRGGGAFRLDELRKQDGHHGLTFPSPILKRDGKDVGINALRALPAFSRGGQRRGTFDVWHRFSRHYPIVGKLTRHYAGLPNSFGPNVLFVPADQRSPVIDDAGIDLLQVFQHLPGMGSHLSLHGYDNLLVRAKVQVSVDTQGSQAVRTETLVHPDRSEKLEKLRTCFHFPAGAYERLSVDEYASGFRVALDEDRDVRHIVKWPSGISQSMEQTEFYVDDFSLNEFGCFFFGLYCAGMYARYFPDLWMRDVDLSNERFSILSSFLDLTSYRLPIVGWMDLSRIYFVETTSG